MTVSHHPPPELLAGFAAGTLDAGEHLAIAVHASGCSTCRRLVRAVEGIGGSALEAIEPAPMKAGAFEAVMAKLDQSPPQSSASTDSVADDDLPETLRHYRIGRRRWVAPGVSMRPIELPGPSRSRVFLLRSNPGTHMLEHTHTGTELTCVLRGSFSHEGGRFGAGDFDFGDETLDHQPTVGDGEPCLCLVTMSGDLRINGFFGRLISPFVRL
ncbi:ChrR family anti-sigma-E factor [Bradyrhizobium sp. McL0615]|uniref:ChrR family anti-sigma-E factor n=1 Tax=Bradyrhizobium sp. McL0615 TaxID=3415673 RepID=UPI003CE6D20F